MKAELKYSNGWILSIPRSGNAPLLFLEWLSQFTAGKNWVHKIHLTTDYSFDIRLNMTKEDIEDGLEYINNNL